MCEYCNVDKYENNLWDGRKKLVLSRGYYVQLIMYYNPNNGKFSIATEGEGKTEIEINHCPRCGKKLAKQSLRGWI